MERNATTVPYTLVKLVTGHSLLKGSHCANPHSEAVGWVPDGRSDRDILGFMLFKDQRGQMKQQVHISFCFKAIVYDI